jgi:tetratricopeptide (TPR) repeat protein
MNFPEERTFDQEKARTLAINASKQVMNSVGLSMIVKDAAASLRACVESAKAVVSEIVVADTGSTDGTIRIAQDLGSRVIRIPWTNDFAEARNRALQEMTTDWVMCLDADEMLDEGGIAKIPKLLEKTDTAGFQVRIRNYVLSLNDRIWDRAAIPNDSLLPAAKKYPAYVEHENVRLFRRSPDVHFVGCVHESVGPRLLELGRKIETAPFLIHHFGLATDAETRERKNRLYRKLGRKKIRERPRDAQAHLELGLTEMDNFGDLHEALRLFRRACQLNSHFGVAWFFEGVVLLRKEKYGDAIVSLAQAEIRGHRTALVAELQGDAYYNLGEFCNAAKFYELALWREPESPQFISKAGLAAVRTGDIESGLSKLQKAIEMKAPDAELHDRLVLALVSLGRIAQAAEAAESKLGAVASPSTGSFLRAAALWAKASEPARAAAVLQIGLQMSPDNRDLQKALSELAQTVGIRAF